MAGDIGPIFPPGAPGGSTPPATPGLQAVTDVSNSTTQNIISGDSAANEIDIDGSFGYIFVKDAGATKSLFGISDVVIFGDIGYAMELYCAGALGYLVFINNNFRMRCRVNTLSGDNFFTIPDARSTPVVVLSINFAGLNTATSYNIAHGQTFTPTSAALTPLNTGAGSLIAGGYWLSYTATNIVLHLVVPTAGTPALSFQFQITSP